MNLLIEQIQDKIKSINDERDNSEQKFYRDKIQLNTEYETKTSLLLNQKLYLQKLLKDYMDRQVNSSEE